MGKKKGIQNMRTPYWLFLECENLVGEPFALDAAADDWNHLVQRHYTEKNDGLSQAWLGPTFCNPPFRSFGAWIKKAWGEYQKRGITSILIGPVGCSQKWFHEYARRGTIFCPDKRISFIHPDGTPTKGANRDTMVYAFGEPFVNPHFTNTDLFRVRPLKIRGRL